MDLTVYQIIIISMALVAHTAGAVGYISKVKSDLNNRVNELNTRTTVLEAGHTIMLANLNEIKGDVKELLAWIHTEQGKK